MKKLLITLKGDLSKHEYFRNNKLEIPEWLKGSHLSNNNNSNELLSICSDKDSYKNYLESNNINKIMPDNFARHNAVFKITLKNKPSRLSFL